MSSGILLDALIPHEREIRDKYKDKCRSCIHFSFNGITPYCKEKCRRQIKRVQMSILDALGSQSKATNRIAGVVPGIVTDNQDPDGLGRVKIRFPRLSDDNETGWVRFCLPGGDFKTDLN